DAGVADLEAQPVALGGTAQLDGAAARRVADRVLHQVADDELYAIVIGQRLAFHGQLAQRQLDRLVGCERAMGIDRLPEQRRRRDRTRVQLDAPRLNARQIEQVLDDALQALAIFARREQQVGLLLRQRT